MNVKIDEPQQSDKDMDEARVHAETQWSMVTMVSSYV